MRKYDGNTWMPPQHVELVPDIGPINVPAGREISTTLKRQMQEGSDKILWLTDETPQDGFSHMESSEFFDVPEWARGRQDSVQGVFFGHLALGTEVEVPVAVKPYISAFNACAHEVAMNLFLESKGLRVYQTLGMSWSQEQGAALISSFEEESRSLDNAKWSRGLSEPLGKYLTNLEAIEQVGQSFGLMHGNGIIHKDAQIKNFAVNGSEVVLIDLTTARSLVDDTGYLDEAGLQAGMYQDLSRFLESLRAKKFLHDASSLEWGRFFINVIAPAYRSGLYLAAGDVDSRDDTLRPIVEEVITDINSLFE